MENYQAIIEELFDLSNRIRHIKQRRFLWPGDNRQLIAILNQLPNFPLLINSLRIKTDIGYTLPGLSDIPEKKTRNLFQIL